MTAPEQAAHRFGVACLMGLLLGVIYSFLRPLRRKHAAPADTVFLLTALWAWLELSFGVCRGDLRLGYSAGLPLGVLAWELTAGKLLKPVFFGFWRGTWGIWRWITRPFEKFFQKIRQFIKFLFASLKKWGTIIWNNRRSMRWRSGGTHGTDEQPPGKHQAGIPKKLATDEDRCGGGCRIVYGSPADAPRSH